MLFEVLMIEEFRFSLFNIFVLHFEYGQALMDE
jgi:hypothetical protein